MSIRTILTSNIVVRIISTYALRYKHKLASPKKTLSNSKLKQFFSQEISKFVIGTIGFKGLFWNISGSGGQEEKNYSSKTTFGKSSRSKDNFIVEVTRKCSPAVVYIEIKDQRRIIPETGLPMTSSNGSGFIIRDDGWIMTNAHVVMNKPNALVMVTTEDGATYKADVMEVDLKTDLALLKIPASNLPALKFGESKDICVGEWVVALGSPLSLAHTITAGVISSVNRDAMELGISNQSMKFIQTDAAITFGHSGGPLVNLDGEVIGINNLRITAGIAFAIPIDYAKEFLSKSVLSSSMGKTVCTTIQRYLGITTLSLNNDMIRQLMYEKNVVPPDLNHGVLVWKVIDGKSAHLGGIRAGDIITHINRHPVYQGADLYNIITNAGKAGKAINLSILREGQKKEINVTF